MEINERDVWFGRSFADYLDGLEAELKNDALGLYAIVGVGRQDFRLESTKLEIFVRRSIERLLEAGAWPVQGSGGAPATWRPAKYANRENKDIVDRIVEEWLTSGRDPDLGGLWFVVPNNMQ